MKEVSQLDINNLEIIRESVDDFIKDASKYDAVNVNVLDIAPQIHKGAKAFFKLAKISTLDIDSDSTATYIADLCNDNSDIIPSNYFDVIICTEVLEHTLNPFNAVKEVYRMLKPKGVCFVTTPFNFRIHGPLPDCWRFTEHGLKQLFKDFKDVTIISVEDTERFLMPIQYKTKAIK
jgi:2-polyprenyl-3-methyl-5-hydroxy-6-metoxy-1,4-benzoquinol methylase